MSSAPPICRVWLALLRRRSRDTCAMRNGTERGIRPKLVGAVNKAISSHRTMSGRRVNSPSHSIGDVLVVKGILTSRRPPQTFATDPAVSGGAVNFLGEGGTAIRDHGTFELAHMRVPHGGGDAAVGHNPREALPRRRQLVRPQSDGPRSRARSRPSSGTAASAAK